MKSAIALFRHVWAGVTAVWRTVSAWRGRQWAAIRPGRAERRGGIWGTLGAALLCVVMAGLYLRTGFGYAFDFALATVVAAVVIPLIALIVALLMTIIRRLPRMATGVIVGRASS